VAVSGGGCGDAYAYDDPSTWQIQTPSEVLGNGTSAVFDLGTPIVGSPGNFYKLCWGHNVGSALSDFNIMVDSAAWLSGPNTGDLLDCTLGLPCEVTVTGYRLEPTSGIVAVSEGLCGSEDALVSNSTWDITNPVEGSTTSAVGDDGVEVWTQTFDVGVPLVGTPGEFYRLCWGFDPEDATEHRTEIDAVASLLGPDMDQTMNCTLGFICRVNVTGFGLGATNQIVLISSGLCGGTGDDAPVVAEEVGGIISPTFESDSIQYYTFNEEAGPTFGVGDYYTLCWGQDPQGDLSKINVAFNCPGCARVLPQLAGTLACTIGLEAFSYGVPVLVRDNEGNSELV
jgi:hypothetical protein